MLVLGCKPAGRNTEQHDVFFGIGEQLKDLTAGILRFWPEADKKIHIDGWRKVTQVDGYDVVVVPRTGLGNEDQNVKLFFINLGGYKPNDLEEYHYKAIIAAPDKGLAIQQAKKTAFFRHTGFEGANSHIDDKYGIDVDDLYEISDILPDAIKQQYEILLTPTIELSEDTCYQGYFRLDRL